MRHCFSGKLPGQDVFIALYIISGSVMYFVNVDYLNNKLDDDHMVRYSDHVSSNSLKRLDSARAARFAGFFYPS